MGNRVFWGFLFIFWGTSTFDLAAENRCSEWARRFYVSLSPYNVPAMQSWFETSVLLKKRLTRSRQETEAAGEIWKLSLKDVLPSDPIIVEGGAHIGLDTLEFAKIWPQSKIYAFEPDRRIFRRLSRNTINHPQIKTYPWALADRHGRASFYVSAGTSDASSSILKPKTHLEEFPSVTFSNHVYVDTINLQDWAKAEGLTQIDLLWLDLQGAEYLALKNSLDLLKRTRLIYLEANHSETYEGTMIFQGLRLWLAYQGFQVEPEYGHRQFSQSNVLFRNTQALP